MPLRLKHMFSDIVLLLDQKLKNAVMNALRSYLRELEFDVDIDCTPVDIVSNLRQDLIIMNNTRKKTHMLDVKVPYDDSSLFMANMVDNSKKYILIYFKHRSSFHWLYLLFFEDKYPSQNP